MQSAVSIDGLVFSQDAKTIQLGKVATHQCHWQLDVEKEAIGALTLQRQQRFTASEINQLENCVSLLAYPVRNSLRYEAALVHALTDPLTGVGNRNNLEATLQRELKLAKRQIYKLTLLVLDVDYFKKINDSYGHDKGDAALQIIAQGIRAMTRDTDRIFRFGGDEFVVLLDNTDEYRARLVGERIRMYIENTHHHNEPALTVTIGTATLLPNDTRESLFKRADAALYRAKQRGRNCVESSLSEYSKRI